MTSTPASENRGKLRYRWFLPLSNAPRSLNIQSQPRKYYRLIVRVSNVTIKMKFGSTVLALVATGAAAFQTPAAPKQGTALFSTPGRLVKPGDVGSGPRVCNS